MSLYTVSETCGCGAAITVSGDHAATLQLALKAFRTDHIHDTQQHDPDSHEHVTQTQTHTNTL